MKPFFRISPAREVPDGIRAECRCGWSIEARKAEIIHEWIGVHAVTKHTKGEK